MTKITPNQAKLIRKLKEAGATDSEVSRALDGQLSRQAVRKHRLAHVDPIAATLAPKASSSPPIESSTTSEPPTTAGAVVEPQERTVSRAAGLDDLKAELSDTNAILVAMRPRLLSGDFPASTWVALVRLKIELNAKVIELTPPPPIDPENDPWSQEAMALTHSKLERAVKSARANSRCIHCGQPPFRDYDDGESRKPPPQ